MGQMFLLLFCTLAYLAPAQEESKPPIDVAPNTVENQYVLKKVPPIYPPLARQARIQGTVILRVIISKSGDVRQLQLTSGHPMLAPAAIDAVRQWKYKPYELNGEPVEVETNVQVNFVLAENPPSTDQSRTDQTTSTAPRRVRISQGVSSGLLEHKVAAKYPREAREQNIQGIVNLRANIDAQGNVYQLEFVSGNSTLAAAAIEAVRQWKYRPYLLNGEPVEVETMIQVQFTLASR